MTDLNEIFELGTRWHAVSKDSRDIMFCEYNGLCAQLMGSLALPKQNWEMAFGYRFICMLPDNIAWDEYVENYHNQELAEFKGLSLDDMCERLRKIYVDCEGNIENFNSHKDYSNFKEILNNAIGIRHGKSKNNSRPATKAECIDAFKEYQSFKKVKN